VKKPQRAPSTKGSNTRAKLVALAERLFAEKGVEAVTLNELYKASGEKNKSLLHYHFGNKDGVLQAILDKHRPGIAAARDLILDQAEAGGNPTLADVVRAAVHPIADKLSDPDGGRYFVIINAQLAMMHTLAFQNLYPTFITFTHPPDRFMRLLKQALGAMPEAAAMHRFMIAATLLFHGLADYSRLIDTYSREDFISNRQLFVASLEEAMIAVMSAPLSPRILSLIDGGAHLCSTAPEVSRRT